MNNDSVSSPSVSPKRRRFSETQIVAFLDQFHGSGSSAASFARQHGLCYATFCRWRKHRVTGTRRGAPRLQALPLDALLGRPWAAEIALADGSALRLQERVSSSWAGELLSALRRSC